MLEDSEIQHRAFGGAGARMQRPRTSRTWSRGHGKGSARTNPPVLDRKPPRPTYGRGPPTRESRLLEETGGGSFWRDGAELVSVFLRAGELIVAVEAKRCWGREGVLSVGTW